MATGVGSQAEPVCPARWLDHSHAGCTGRSSGPDRCLGEPAMLFILVCNSCFSVPPALFRPSCGVHTWLVTRRSDVLAAHHTACLQMVPLMLHLPVRACSLRPCLHHLPAPMLADSCPHASSLHCSAVSKDMSHLHHAAHREFLHQCVQPMPAPLAACACVLAPGAGPGLLCAFGLARALEGLLTCCPPALMCVNCRA